MLATLPLILAPMLSYLFTPMIIPVTATIAAGKKRRRRATTTENKILLPVTLKPNAKHDLQAILGIETNTEKPPGSFAEEGNSKTTANGDPTISNAWSYAEPPLDPRLKEIQVQNCLTVLCLWWH